MRVREKERMNVRDPRKIPEINRLKARKEDGGGPREVTLHDV